MAILELLARPAPARLVAARLGRHPGFGLIGARPGGRRQSVLFDYQLGFSSNQFLFPFRELSFPGGDGCLPGGELCSEALKVLVDYRGQLVVEMIVERGCELRVEHRAGKIPRAAPALN